jgi:ankyrin repeat protein
MARAARFGHAGIVNRLLSAKADLNLAGAPFRITPLLAAAEAGHTAIIQELMASGAFPNAQEGINGYTPLMLATAGGHLESVKALMAGGASPYLKSFEGAGLYDMLRYSNNPEIGKLIESYLLEDD